jgi:hypothetical protein
MSKRCSKCNTTTGPFRKDRNICLKCKQRHQRSYELRRRYNLTPEEWDALFKKQRGKCAICRRPPLRRLHVDHCHKTGKVRGLLCWACNSGVGKLKDCPATMLRAAKYIRKHKNARD